MPSTAVPAAEDDPFAAFITASPAPLAAPPAPAASGWDAIAGRIAAPATEATAADGDDIPWWDLDVPPAAEAADGTLRGHFALGGHALFPGQPVIAGVTYRRPLDAAPVAGAGAVDLRVDAALNCDPARVRVVDDPGFGPTAEGFAVRAEAAEVGLFMVSGTYEVREG